jgi:cob(I)alamin adenosyltransferase
MSSFFSGLGDDGTTGLLGEGRIPKYDLRMETIGAIDESSAQLGHARFFCAEKQSADVLLQIQRHLYELMGEIAATPENAERFHVVQSDHVIWLEDMMGQIGQQVKMPGDFIIPGDTHAGALLDIARTVVRKAERRVAELLSRGDIMNFELLRYLNRLSSLLFLLELFENQSVGKIKPTLAKGKGS